MYCHSIFSFIIHIISKYAILKNIINKYVSIQSERFGRRLEGSRRSKCIVFFSVIVGREREREREGERGERERERERERKKERKNERGKRTFILNTIQTKTIYFWNTKSNEVTWNFHSSKASRCKICGRWGVDLIDGSSMCGDCYLVQQQQQQQHIKNQDYMIHDKHPYMQQQYYPQHPYPSQKQKQQQQHPRSKRPQRKNQHKSNSNQARKNHDLDPMDPSFYSDAPLGFFLYIKYIHMNRYDI